MVNVCANAYLASKHYWFTLLPVSPVTSITTVHFYLSMSVRPDRYFVDVLFTCSLVYKGSRSRDMEEPRFEQLMVKLRKLQQGMTKAPGVKSVQTIIQYSVYMYDMYNVKYAYNTIQRHANLIIFLIFCVCTCIGYVNSTFDL